MHLNAIVAVWISFKENMNCKSKASDAVHWPEKYTNWRNYVSENEKSGSKRHQMQQLISRQNQMLAQFCELNPGDQSRNVVEMIFQTSFVKPLKHSMEIKRVFKVKNAINIIERFENYRETVKMKAQLLYNGEPRCIVDGNECLGFYGTTITCCSRNRSRVTEPCHDPVCRVCRIIESNFEAEFTQNVVELSTSTDAFSNNRNAKGKNVKRAVIVCRTIAGKVISMADEYNEHEYDSIIREELHSNTKNLVVGNSNAVLPCFVIVFS